MNQRIKKVAAKEILILFNYLLVLGIIYVCSIFYEENHTSVYWTRGTMHKGFYAQEFTERAGIILFNLAYTLRIVYYLVKWAINTLKEPSTT